MKSLKKLRLLLTLVLVFALISPVLIPNHPMTKVASAASIKMSKKSLNLVVKTSKKLKLQGAKGNITWTSSKKSIATVNKSGKVTAKAPGTATITAKFNSKKYTCKVTVTPFATQSVKNGSFTYSIPKEWTTKSVEAQGMTQTVAYPSNANPNLCSGVVIKLVPTGNPAPDYREAKEGLTTLITEESQLAAYKQVFKAQGNDDSLASISNFKQSDYNTKLGTALKSEFKISYASKAALENKCYDMFIDDYMIEVISTNNYDKTSPDVALVSQYIMDTLKLSK